MIIENFGGELPGVTEANKNPNAAGLALNLLVNDGLVPWSFAPTEVRNVAVSEKSVVKVDGEVFTFPGEFAVRSPVVNDVNGRIYFNYDEPVNGQTAYVVYSKGTNGTLLGTNSVTRKLGVAIADTPLMSVTNATIEPPTNEAPVVTYYACTLTNQWGEEGAMSLPSGQATLYSNTTLTLSRPTNAVTDDIAYWNIYMANNGQWQLMQQVPKATPDLVLVGDAAKFPVLGEICPSLDWLPPPTDLRNMAAMSGGFMAGYSGRFVCFSEPYLPHAWPSGYQYPTQYDILGIVPVNGGAVVVTNGRQYIAMGASPSVMQMQQLELDAGCVSRDSIVDMGDFAIYASHLGLVKLGTSGVELISEAAWPRHKWTAISPTTIKAARLKHYYVFQSSAMSGYVYVMDTNTGEITRSDKFTMTDLLKGFYDPIEDKTYFIRTSGTRKLVSLSLATVFGAQWKSKVFTSNEGFAPSWGLVESDAYPVTVSVETSNNGTTWSLHDYIVASRSPFRLAAGQTGFVKFGLSAFTGNITRVVLTNNRAEIV